MKGVQCYELFAGIALENHAFFYVVNNFKIHQLFDVQLLTCLSPGVVINVLKTTAVAHILFCLHEVFMWFFL